MGIQSGINQLLGMSAGAAFLANTAADVDLKETKTNYEKAKKLEKEHFENIVEPQSKLLAQRQGPPSEAEIYSEGLTEKEVAQIGNRGLISKLKGNKELKTETNKAYFNMQKRDKLISEAKRNIIKSKEFQDAKAELKQRYKDILGKSHMQKSGTSKANEIMTFKEFFESVKQNPPEVYGDKNAFNKLGSNAQEAIAKNLYNQRRNK